MLIQINYNFTHLALSKKILSEPNTEPIVMCLYAKSYHEAEISALYWWHTDLDIRLVQECLQNLSFPVVKENEMKARKLGKHIVF